MTMSRAALTISLLAAAAPCLAQPSYSRPSMNEAQARDQNQQNQAAAQPNAAPQRQYNLSRAERTALQPALQAAQQQNWAAVQAALPAAVAAAQGADARYVAGQIALQAGIGLQNTQLQAQGIDLMVASGQASPEQLPALYTNQARFAADAGDITKADGALDQLTAVSTNDPLAIARAAQFWIERNNAAHALDYYRRAVTAAEAAGHPVAPDVRRQALAMSYRAHLPMTLQLSREYLAVAPSATAWHDALAIYRELTNADNGLKLDIYRLMRAAGSLTSERDYIEYAEAANGTAAFGEVKAVLEEAIARHALTSNAPYANERLQNANQRITADRASLATERTAALAGSNGTAALRLGDAYFGYGQYAQAAELYRAAQQKGADSATANLRLGAALALAGQRAEAEAAFRAVTGSRAELAQLWLLWLSMPHA